MSLSEYIKEHELATPVLPVFHATSSIKFEDILKENRIRPSNCENFGEKILYLFYGRPAYRV